VNTARSAILILSLAAGDAATPRLTALQGLDTGQPELRAEVVHGVLATR
jgi:hypothetical protein